MYSCSTDSAVNGRIFFQSSIEGFGQIGNLTTVSPNSSILIAGHPKIFARTTPGCVRRQERHAVPDCFLQGYVAPSLTDGDKNRSRLLKNWLISGRE